MSKWDEVVESVFAMLICEQFKWLLMSVLTRVLIMAVIFPGPGSGEGKIACGQCGEWLHPRSMARHVERRHAPQPTRVTCDVCSKDFATLVNLKEHYRSAHGLSTRYKM